MNSQDWIHLDMHPEPTVYTAMALPQTPANLAQGGSGDRLTWAPKRSSRGYFKLKCPPSPSPNRQKSLTAANLALKFKSKQQFSRRASRGVVEKWLKKVNPNGGCSSSSDGWSDTETLLNSSRAGSSDEDRSTVHEEEASDFDPKDNIGVAKLEFKEELPVPFVTTARWSHRAGLARKPTPQEFARRRLQLEAY